jgi:hypothetical protein
LAWTPTVETIDQMLAAHGLPARTRRDDSALESAAADNELVRFVNKVIIDAHNQKSRMYPHR